MGAGDRWEVGREALRWFVIFLRRKVPVTGSARTAAKWRGVFEQQMRELNPNTAIGSSPYSAAIAAARQGDSWAVFFNTAAASRHDLQQQAQHRLCHLESSCSG
jgi:hypothetical protein